MINLPYRIQTSQRGAWRRSGIAMVVACILLAAMPVRAEMPTTPLLDINPGAAGSDPADFTSVGATSFFVANTAQAGYELWKSDGTPAGTMLVKDINPGAASSSPTWLTSTGEKLFFFADDGSSGMELWVSDGTPAGTVRTKDIAAGSVSSYDINFTPRPINLNGVLIFGVHYIAESQSHTGLWRSDGTAAGTTMVKDLKHPGFAPVYHMERIGGTVFFAADNGEPYSGGLWKTDGTPAGTTPVKYLQYITELKAVGNTLFLKGGLSGEIPADELWKSDGTEAGTVMVKDINVGNQGSSITELVEFNGQLFFQANGGDQMANPSTATGAELWKSDGTEAGTQLVKDIEPGFFGSTPMRLTPVGDTLYFTAQGHLWKTDGTTAGTVQVEDASGRLMTAGLTDIDGKLLFWSGNNNEHGLEPWTTDGTAACTRQIQDIAPGAASSATIFPLGKVMAATAGQKVVFSADNGQAGTELWTLSRAADATLKTRALTPAQAESSVIIPISYDNYGLGTATNAVITATLDPQLTYVGDSSGITPVVSGSVVRWNIPALSLRCGGTFLLSVATPAGAINSTYPIQLAIAFDGPEAYAADNTAEAVVTLKRFTYLPAIQR